MLDFQSTPMNLSSEVSIGAVRCEGGPEAPPDSTPGERPEESGDGPLPLVLLLSAAGIAAIAAAVWASRRAGRQAA